MSATKFEAKNSPLPNMQNFMFRSVSSEMGQKTSQTPTKSIGGITFPVKTTNTSNESKVFDRKPSRSGTLQEKRVGRGSEMQPQMHQLQDELKKAKEEITKALEDLEELRTNKKMFALSSKEEMALLEKKVEKAKESERKMLESLISQTKQLEQTKISLEESKLEIKSLCDNVKLLEDSFIKKSHEYGNGKQNTIQIIQAHEEIRALKKELKLAVESEEKSKKAMDDLVIALTEMNSNLSVTQLELEKVKNESIQKMAMLKASEDQLRASVEVYEKFKVEFEDLNSVLREKQIGFMNCMKASEEEIANLKSENSILIDALRGSREETSKLRDLLRQAVIEAKADKEALEIARNENSQLKELLSSKEGSLQSLKQESESLKVSEAAAVDCVKELKGFLAAATDLNESKRITKLPSPVKVSSGRRHSFGGSGKFLNGLLMERKNYLFPSMSNVSDSKVPSSIYTENKAMSAIDFDSISRANSDGLEHMIGSPLMMKKKKRSLMRRIGDAVRRKSFYK